MKQFLSFIHKALFLLAVATISVAFEGCSEVADKTIDGIKDLPAQIIQMATPETVESVGSEKNMTPETAATEYNYIYFRYNNQWVTNKLISYEVVDSGQNIKFTVEGNSVANYYTSMANVVLMHKDENNTRTQNIYENWRRGQPMADAQRGQFEIDCKSGEAAGIIYGLVHDKTMFRPELDLANAHPKEFDNEHIFPLDMFINSDYLLKLSREEFAKELKRLFDEDIIGYAQVVVATDIHDMHRIVVLTDPTQMDKLSRIAVSLFGVPKREARRIIAKYQAQ